jgi:hypothetical protein
VAVFGLDGKQPLEGDESHIHHVAALHPLAGQQQGMGQFAVGIIQGVLKPGPIVCCMVFKLIEKPVGQDFPDPAHIAVTGEFIQVGMHAHEAKSDGPGRMKIFDRSQGLFEEGRTHCQMPGF